jgi:hypothetical protein
MKVGKDDVDNCIDRWDSRRIKELLTDMGYWSKDAMTPTKNESAVEGLDTRDVNCCCWRGMAFNALEDDIDR